MGRRIMVVGGMVEKKIFFLPTIVRNIANIGYIVYG